MRDFDGNLIMDDKIATRWKQYLEVLIPGSRRGQS